MLFRMQNYYFIFVRDLQMMTNTCHITPNARWFRTHNTEREEDMNEEQRSFIPCIDTASTGRVIVKDTGREGIDLAPHRHNCTQLVETVTGTLRVTVGEREYFVPEGYACWIPHSTTHALASNNRRIALQIGRAHV